MFNITIGFEFKEDESTNSNLDSSDSEGKADAKINIIIVTTILRCHLVLLYCN